jgi:hypothetical protein
MSVMEIKDMPSELIAQFLKLRKERTSADETYAEFRKQEYDTPMQEIENKLLDAMNQMGVDSLKAKTGTAFKKLSTSVTTADGAAFRSYVIDGELWDMVDWRPNKTAVNDLVGSGQPLPPGLNRTTFFNVNVRVPTKGDRE